MEQVRYYCTAVFIMLTTLTILTRAKNTTDEEQQYHISNKPKDLWERQDIDPDTISQHWAQHQNHVEYSEEKDDTAKKSWRRFLNSSKNSKKSKNRKKHKKKNTLASLTTIAPFGSMRYLTEGNEVLSTMNGNVKHRTKDKDSRSKDKIECQMNGKHVCINSSSVSRVTAAVYESLNFDQLILPQTLQELHDFSMPFASGSFQKGENFFSVKGRFSIPKTGLYQITVFLHITHPGFRARAPRKLRRSEYVKASVCIDSKCDQNTSLMYLSGIESNTNTFTINFSGTLHLQKSQYVSIYFDNNTRRQLIIKKGSTFISTALAV